MLTLSSVSACRTSNSVVAIGPGSAITSVVGQTGKGGQGGAEQAGIVAQLGSDDRHFARSGSEDLATGDLCGPLDITLAKRLGDPAANDHHRRIQQVDNSANRQPGVARAPTRRPNGYRVILRDRQPQVATGQRRQVAVQNLGQSG